jgi:hypothetical protein
MALPDIDGRAWNFNDISTERFGRLRPVRVVRLNKYNAAVWLCECDCGNLTDAVGIVLRQGRKRSCGCLKKDVSAQSGRRSATHGHARQGAKTPEWVAWHTMRYRCLNPRSKKWVDYGGRGITVCDDWTNSFENFLRDMGYRPSPRHTLERKNNELGYSKNNCVWATMIEQSNNRRSTKMVEFHGRRVGLTILAREHGLDPARVRRRVRMGWSVDRALAEPVHTEFHGRWRHEMAGSLK